MEWQQIIGFYHVAKSGSCTRAAEATYRTQSAVSHQIKKLEIELGCLLFERIGKKQLQLTLAGQELFQFAQHMIKEQENVINKIDFIKGMQTGLIKIACPPDILDYLLPKSIERYRTRFPDVKLQLFDMLAQNVITLVRSGDADIGMTVESLVPKDLSTIRWKKANYMLLMRNDHPLLVEEQINIEKIVKHPLIIPPPQNKSRSRAKLLGMLDKLGLKYYTAMEASNIQISMKYASLGIGVYFTLCSNEVLDSKPSKLEAIPLTHIFGEDYISLVLRKDKIVTGVFEAFIDGLLDENDKGF